ncbi:MAG TPA: PQQ-binding-like beta-propeller repeat protein [Pyrinomonadaceae bacterium]|nr:PQQ-binding-like beta-propeller repeat protein [Pyrinomonadaceae bacterium]
MTYNPPKILQRGLSLLALTALLLAPAAAQRKPAAKKTAPQKTATPASQSKAPADAQQKPQAQQSAPSILVRWEGKPGIDRYRLQLATDEKFEDIVFDQAVEGRQYVVQGLPPGDYFWRVAPAAAETSVTYTPPVRVALSSSAGGVEVANVLMPSDSSGWRTATGDVATLVPARLRTGAVVDFVGVGTDGRAFAVDGASGISLWTARYGTTAAPAGASAFAPVVVRAKQGESNVVVASEGGVRALQGETGKELWRASLEGRAASGVADDAGGDASTEVFVVTQSPDRFYVLDSSTGRVVASQKLEGEAAGAPYPVAYGSTRGVAVGIKKGRVELRGADGSVVAAAKVEGEVTTAPIAVTRGQMTILVVGTDSGLWAMSVPEMKVLGVIKADGDSVRGTLAAADVDGDGSQEIVMLTKLGRVALVSTSDGNVRWASEGATDAATASFADVNGDGVLDVIVAGGRDFALGFSGKDGSLVMKVAEGGKRPVEQAAGSSLRTLVVTPSLGGGGMLVGGDPAHVGLRAVELPKGSVKTASK